MKHGLYSVAFAVMGNQGGGVVTYHEGQIAGGDAGFAYLGKVSEDGSKLSGTIEVFQHDPGFPSVFPGLTNFELSVEGSAQSDGSATLAATTSAAPGLKLNIAMRFLRPL